MACLFVLHIVFCRAEDFNFNEVQLSSCLSWIVLLAYPQGDHETQGHLDFAFVIFRICFYLGYFGDILSVSSVAKYIPGIGFCHLIALSLCGDSERVKTYDTLLLPPSQTLSNQTPTSNWLY